MTQAEKLARFVVRTRFEELSEEVRQLLRIRILDSLGCALGALESEPIAKIRSALEDQGQMQESGSCFLIGGGRASPPVAAFFNGALVRYLDFNDSFLARGETCHPSDNLGALLAATEHAGGAIRDLITALAVAYEVQCALSETAPVRGKGFDHTTQGAYALAAGLSKALGLDELQTANAVAMSGAACNALRVTRTGALSHWKGLAYPHAAFSCTQIAFLAKHGITGPREVFEGNKGFMDSIAGPFEMDWDRRSLESVRKTILKKYNAEIHSQTAIETVLELKESRGFTADQIDSVHVEVFDVAYHIIGGGEEGEKQTVRTKEEADHSLPYILSAAILDGGVMPEQYSPERIQREDIQRLLRRVQVTPSQEFSRQFPDRMPCRVTVRLRNGRRCVKYKEDYEGFWTRPLLEEAASKKFRRLCGARWDPDLESGILERLDRAGSPVADLLQPLSRFSLSPA